MNALLQERKEFYSLLGEATPGLVWASDAAGHVDYVNRAWTDYTGLPLEEVDRLGWMSVMHPDDLPAMQAGVQHAAERGESFNAEFRCRGRDGTYRWFMGRITPVPDVDGQARQWVGTSVDIEELKRAQEALRHSERHYAEATAAGRVGVFDCDLEGQQVYADPMLPMLLGHAPNEHPSGEGWLKRVHPVDRQRIIELGRSILDNVAGRSGNGNTAIPATECRVVRANGHVHWISMRGTVLRRQDGTPLRIIGTISDVSARKRVERKLQERLRFETLLGELSAALATAAPQRTEEVLPDWLRRIGEFLGAEQVSIAQLVTGSPTLQITHGWTADGAWPWSKEAWTSTAAVVLEYLYRGALLRRVNSTASGVRVLLGIPLTVGGQSFGMLLLGGNGERMWPQAIAKRLQVLGRMLANVLGRKQMEATMRQSEALNTAVLASIAGQVAIIDQSGVILQVNETWARYAREQSTGPTHGVGVGTNYLEVCRQAAATGDGEAAYILGRLEAVLAGQQASFSFEYNCRLPGKGDAWYELWVARLARREGGAVVFSLDCTARKGAEAEAQRHRQELAHVLRVATLGELASSLAHELNQPLTAILSNAQAARRLLDAPSSERDEVQSVLADIVHNDRRASAIVRHMRTFMKKGEVELQWLPLSDLVQDVVQLVRTDLVLRQVAITLDLEEPSPKVCGDPVQLQQVLLNLILNGLEAMAETPIRERRLAIRTTWRDAKMADVAIRDTGNGIPPEQLGRVFDAYFTTKPRGLGMGLSIARTIVEAYGGRVWAANNVGRGTTVGFTVPAEWD